MNPSPVKLPLILSYNLPETKYMENFRYGNQCYKRMEKFMLKKENCTLIPATYLLETKKKPRIFFLGTTLHCRLVSLKKEIKTLLRNRTFHGRTIQLEYDLLGDIFLKNIKVKILQKLPIQKDKVLDLEAVEKFLSTFCQRARRKLLVMGISNLERVRLRLDLGRAWRTLKHPINAVASFTRFLRLFVTFTKWLNFVKLRKHALILIKRRLRELTLRSKKKKVRRAMKILELLCLRRKVKFCKNRCLKLSNAKEVLMKFFVFVYTSVCIRKRQDEASNIICGFSKRCLSKKRKRQQRLKEVIRKHNEVVENASLLIQKNFRKTFAVRTIERLKDERILKEVASDRIKLFLARRKRKNQQTKYYKNTRRAEKCFEMFVKNAINQITEQILKTSQKFTNCTLKESVSTCTGKKVLSQLQVVGSHCKSIESTSTELSLMSVPLKPPVMAKMSSSIDEKETFDGDGLGKEDEASIIKAWSFNFVFSILENVTSSQCRLERRENEKKKVTKVALILCEECLIQPAEIFCTANSKTRLSCGLRLCSKCSLIIHSLHRNHDPRPI
eukprot:snap_masked-scaffold_26-processed-gene-1.31-mRNA-1 protein AED:1.00 eAED:1.00 QI:0/-1/0/0/-1/1/1/0/557